ncbi:MAG: cation-translocating P-type ATPase C-terminal domain-containing protein, partial [Gemmatimonadota bacterium]|nr:cation-translocating P-type ATPase C-terminal domain-containing protein [Gemmatimonadota bacterium]
LTIGLQLMTLYVPALTRVFRTEPLSAGDLAACLLLSTIVFFGVELEKWMIRRGRLFREGATP